MKRKLFTIALLFGLLLTGGCQSDFTEEKTTLVDGGVQSLTISLEQTRTALGEKVNDFYPVYWSEGDRVSANGISSNDVEINAEDRTRATFSFDGTLNYPINITYPHTSTSTANAPKVVFPAEQAYTEGTYAANSTPMCGYVEKSSDKISLKHLAGVLRFPVKASGEGIVLDKIVITSTEGVKLSGEFSVNCSAATIVATNNSSNTLTYTLPDNFTLSTNNESIFYISLPAGTTGACKVEFIEASGEKMTSLWSSKEIKAGIVREFKTIVYKRGVDCQLEWFEVEDDTLDIFYPTIYGYVKDTSGKPIAGVSVSDGFNVVQTDSKGYYSIRISHDSWYVYISLPSEYEVPINEYGQPCFYKRILHKSPRYDFTLTPLAGGKEKKFALVAIGDPQVSSAAKLTRFNNEAVPGLKAYGAELKAMGLNCYGITLGDIISNGDNSDSSAYRDDMRDGFNISKTGFPIFQVMGNHDNTHYNSSKPIMPDATSSTYELRAQRAHEEMFGPVNYSFNRGDVHIIGMRDIVYSTNTTSGSYKTGFLKSQWEWLKQDLSFVPKDKMVVLCVHIQLRNTDMNYVQDVLSLFDQYKEAHIISGHSHIMQNYEHTVEGTGHKVYEHNSCALCGCWWAAKIAGDGTPNGYQVFIGEGNTFSEWYYMGYSKGMNTKSHQMRLYRGNQANGTAKSGTDTYGVKGFYGFNFSDDVLLANVYNADSKWTIKVYENGVHTGNMTKIKYSQPGLSALIGDGTLENPKRAADGVVTSHDFYVTGLLLGTLGRNPSSAGSFNNCYHLYQYKLKNKSATIKVVATDRFGNEYTETKITAGTDFSVTK